MRIAINASILDSHPTGMGVYAVNVIRELAGLAGSGDQLTVFTGYPAAFADCGVEIAPLSPLAQPRYGKAAGVWRFLWTQTSLPARIIGGRFDLLYHMTHHGLPYRLPGVAQVLTIQSDVQVAFEFPHQHRLQHQYFRHVVPHLIQASSGVITTSEYAMNVLQRTYGVDSGKLHYAYNAYDPACFTVAPAVGDPGVLSRYGLESNRYVLAVGATYPHKNTGTLLSGFDRWSRDGGSSRLCIAGYRPSHLMPLLRRLAPQLRSRVVAIPYVAQPELAALYRNAVCLVVASFHESFGMPCVEAMACGCPVVAAQASALGEVCGDAAYYIDPTSPQTITDALGRLVMERDLAERLRTEGRRRAGRFTWRATAETAYDVLCRVQRNGEREPAAVASPTGRVR